MSALSKFESKEVDIQEVVPNREQPRKFFDNVAIEELAQSIRAQGILQPLIVSFDQNLKKYLLIAGERRYRAAKIAGLLKVPVTIKQCEPEEALRIALIENIQRSDLNVIEEAQAIKSLMRDHGLTQEECARTLGKDRSTISNTLRMLTLSKDIQEDLISGRLSPGHGRALAGIEDKNMLQRAREIIIKRELSVRKTEELCRSMRVEPDSKEKAKENPDLEYIEECLRAHLRTKVRVQGSSERGRIEISYFSGEELSRVLDQMGGSI